MVWFFALAFFSPLITAQSYCACGPTTNADANLGPTSLAGNSSKIDDRTDCPGTAGPRDFTYMYADLYSGKNYTLTTTVTTCGGLYQTLCGAWIDWNQDRVFSSNETVGSFSSAKNLVSWNFSVPSSARNGTTRLRVQVQETYGTSLNPCTDFYYGGTKDFTITVNSGAPPPSYCSSGPTQLQDTNLGATSLSGDTQKIDDQSDCREKTIGPNNLTNLTADVSSGKTYTLTTTVDTCGNNYPTVCGAWIDWNQNLVFDPQEVLGPFSKAKNRVSWNFTVPASAVSGPTRMRVQVQETQAASIFPCEFFTYGATKDFNITVTK